MKEIHLTKKDFKIEWYSGAGDQHRNKHQNCCRIIHIETRMVEHGTESKSRISNQEFLLKDLLKGLLDGILIKKV